MCLWNSRTNVCIITWLIRVTFDMLVSKHVVVRMIKVIVPEATGASWHGPMAQELSLTYTCNFTQTWTNRTFRIFSQRFSFAFILSLRFMFKMRLQLELRHSVLYDCLTCYVLIHLSERCLRDRQGRRCQPPISSCSFLWWSRLLKVGRRNDFEYLCFARLRCAYLKCSNLRAGCRLWEKTLTRDRYL